MELPYRDGVDQWVDSSSWGNVVLAPSEYPRAAAETDFGLRHARLPDEEAIARSMGHLDSVAVIHPAVVSVAHTRLVGSTFFDDGELFCFVETPGELSPADAITGVRASATTLPAPKTPALPSPTPAIP